jgi:hypothetical protein
VAVSVETNLLARNIFVIDVRTVAQRFSVQGAEIVEVAALILFAVPGFDSTGPPIRESVVAPGCVVVTCRVSGSMTFRPLTLSAFPALYRRRRQCWRG